MRRALERERGEKLAMEQQVAGLRAVLQAERHQKGSLTQSVADLKKSLLMEKDQNTALKARVRVRWIPLYRCRCDART